MSNNNIIDATDATLYQSNASEIEINEEPPIQQIIDAIDSKLILDSNDYYDMKHKNRGVAIIFNHLKFEDRSLNERQGTVVDGQCINASLTKLGFNVSEYKDLKYGQIYQILKDVANEDHIDNDCLVIVVMSHGDSGIIHARDVAYPPNCLWSPFASEQCASLAGKPKLFFIQACRGAQLDAGVQVTDECDSVNTNYTTHAMPDDFLVMYSTTQDHYSFRSPLNGSWFIQSLCRELDERANKQDILTILTLVNRAMAFGFNSNTPGNSTFHDKKQVGSIVSGLTHLLNFKK